MARLIRDIEDGAAPRGQEGWVPATFLDPFPGQLEVEEYMFACYGPDKTSVKLGAEPRSRALTVPAKQR